MSAQVLAVSSCATHSLSKPNQLIIRLLAGIGVEGDAHGSKTLKNHAQLEDPNLRQVHLIHFELLQDLKGAGFDLLPGQLGENLTTQGLDLLSLPTGARLHLGDSAVVEVTGLRNPCKQLESIQKGLMKALMVKDPQGDLKTKAGIMGVVLADGDVRPGDAIRIEMPPHPHRSLEPV